MAALSDDPLGFARDDDAPIPYMARTRAYYQAIGYATPYRWAHYTAAPFQPLRKPLKDSRIAIVTTAAPFEPGAYQPERRMPSLASNETLRCGMRSAASSTASRGFAR